ncbi:MAG: carbon-nitrogen hydrolase family protein [Opitutae bacterium]|nr:carbon-nitrogen hydrolase family protein [Opitutae bacterium]
MNVVGGQREENLRHAGELVDAAKAQGAEVVLLPEAADVGWTHPRSRELATAIPDGAACAALREAARRNRVYVCAGLTERAGDRVFNAAVLLSPEGDVLLLHRKLNELAIGHDVYDQGDRLGVVHTPLATFGLMICADGYVPGHYVGRTLGLKGADVILSPSAWAVRPDHDNEKRPYGADWERNYAAVAREFHVWVAGCSNVGRVAGGPWNSYLCIGRSMVVDPAGRTALVGPFGATAEEIMLLRVSPRPRPARGAEWENFAKKSLPDAMT